MLRDDGPLVALAGATDLYVSLNFGTLSATRFLDLWALEPLRRIEMRGDVLSLGALATYTSLTRSRLVKQRLPMLVDAARQVGGVQIQNRGTIGGNIANGSPAGDTLPVFAAAEAVVVIRSAGTERRAPFTEFYSGYRTSVLRPEELIVAVETKAQQRNAATPPIVQLLILTGQRREEVEDRLSMQVEDVGVEDLVLVLCVEVEQARRLAPGKEALLLHAEAQVEILAFILIA